MEELERRCNQRQLLACNNLAVKYADGLEVEKDRERAAALWDDACTFGFARACFNLAGLHGWENVDAWLPLMTRGCDLGDRLPCERLGEAYATGQLGYVDLVKSTSYYERACELGRADSCIAVSEAVRAGRGVSPDPVRADELFTRACELSPNDPRCKRRP